MKKIETLLFWATVLVSCTGVESQQKCQNISQYSRSVSGGKCRSNNQVELCRWVNVNEAWKELAVKNETFVSALMNGMDEHNASVKLSSNRLCQTPDSQTYEFRFLYYIENTSNCELSVHINKSDSYEVLWSSSWRSAGFSQTVNLTNATCSNCEYQIVFEGKKRHREQCVSGLGGRNIIGVTNIGYSQIITTASHQAPIAATATTLETTASATVLQTNTTIQTTEAMLTAGPTSTARSPIATTTRIYLLASTSPVLSRDTTSSSSSPYTSTKTDNITVHPAYAEDDGGSLSGGVVAGIVVGIAVVVVIVAVVILLLKRRKSNCFKSCLLSKLMLPSPRSTSQTATNSRHIGDNGNIRENSTSSISPPGQSVYELADATHLQEYANLRSSPLLTDEMGYQIPCQPQSSRRYQESGLEESVLEESNYDTTEDTHAGNHYSIPDDATSENRNSTNTNSVTVTTTRMHQPKGDNVYELSDEPNMGRNRVLPEDSYNKLSHLNPRSQAPVPEGAHPYNHIADDVRNKTTEDGSQYSLVHADDPRYSQIGEALRNTRIVPEDGNEYSLAGDHIAENNVFSSTPIEADCGVEYSLERALDDTESGMSLPQPQLNTWSEYSLAGAHGTTDTTDIAANSAAHVDYYNTVDFNTRGNAGPMEEYNALNFDSSNSNDGDKRGRQNDGYNHVMKGPKPPNTAKPETVQSDFVNDNQNVVYHILEGQSD